MAEGVLKKFCALLINQLFCIFLKIGSRQLYQSLEYPIFALVCVVFFLLSFCFLFCFVLFDIVFVFLFLFLCLFVFSFSYSFLKKFLTWNTKLHRQERHSCNSLTTNLLCIVQSYSSCCVACSACLCASHIATSSTLYSAVVRHAIFSDFCLWNFFIPPPL